jgi:hypothetical protein
LGKEREEEHGEEFVTTTHMFSDKVLPIANKAVTNTDAGRGECDVENFDMIVQDLNTIAEYFTPKIQSNMQGLLDLPVDTSDKRLIKFSLRFHSDKSSCSWRRHQSCEQSVSRNSQENTMSLYKMQRAHRNSTIFFDVCHVRSDGSVGDLSVILLTTSDLPDDVHRIADGSFCIAPSKHP